MVYRVNLIDGDLCPFPRLKKQPRKKWKRNVDECIDGKRAGDGALKKRNRFHPSSFRDEKII